MEMNIKRMALADLNPAAYNPRKELKPGDEQFEKLKRSIETFGYVEPIIVNTRTGNTVIGGHQRLNVLKEIGETEAECVLVDLSENEEKALNVALNKVTGEWDEPKLAELLQGIKVSEYDITLTGFDAPEAEDLINGYFAKGAKQDDGDEEGEKQKIEEAGETITKPGDVWKLGQHRLICGDSTDPVTFEKLMAGAHAQLTVTSPPYGVGKSYEEKGIQPWFDTMRPVVKNVAKHSDIVCWNLGDLYSTGTQYIEPTSFYSIGMFEEYGFKPIWIRIWKKQGMNFGVGPYHLVTNKPVQQWEYITAFEKEDNDGTPTNEQEYEWLMAFAGHAYKFVKRLSKQERKAWGYAGIWDINTVTANKLHPAMFPVELPWRCIKMHSDEGNIVLEPFSGSGTTMIACEQLGRKCYGVERDPVYCDLAVKRWEEFTGMKAEKEADHV